VLLNVSVRMIILFLSLLGLWQARVGDPQTGHLPGFAAPGSSVWL